MVVVTSSVVVVDSVVVVSGRVEVVVEVLVLVEVLDGIDTMNADAGISDHSPSICQYACNHAPPPFS